jgi:hypothetical protein
MSYEQAIDLIGDAPAWVLQSIIERQPRNTRDVRAAMLLLRTKKQHTER